MADPETLRIGIDPGLDGAIAWYSDDPECCRVCDMPTVARRTGKGREVSAGLLTGLLCAEIAPVFVERVSPMPGQGVVGVFSFGRSLGVVEGVLSALRLSYSLVTPQAWKRRAGLIGRPKDEARTLAIQQFPHLAADLARKRDAGRADALLIAKYGAC